MICLSSIAAHTFILVGPCVFDACGFGSSFGCFLGPRVFDSSFGYFLGPAAPAEGLSLLSPSIAMRGKERKERTIARLR